MSHEIELTALELSAQRNNALLRSMFGDMEKIFSSNQKIDGEANE